MTQRLAALATILLFTGLTTPAAFAQSLDNPQGGAVELNEPPPAAEYPAKGATPSKGSAVGRKAATKYMAPNTQPASEPSRGSDAHYLAVHVGSFVSDNSYKWGSKDSETNVGHWNVGVTYRVGEWTNSMDLGIRIDLQNYGLANGTANKLSFVPIITFPDATSHFPLYFGAGIGPGIFVSQVQNESAISLDYQIFAGVRFFDVAQNVGFFVEAGMKNHFLLLSDGQFNGTFVAAGAVFNF